MALATAAARTAHVVVERLANWHLLASEISVNHLAGRRESEDMWMRWTKKRTLSFKVQSLSSRDYLKKENTKRKKGKCARQQKQSVDRDTANYDRFLLRYGLLRKIGSRHFSFMFVRWYQYKRNQTRFWLAESNYIGGRRLRCGSMWKNARTEYVQRRWNRKLFMRKIQCEMNEKTRRQMGKVFSFF